VEALSRAAARDIDERALELEIGRQPRASLGRSIELREANERVAELDAASKGGSRLPADLELERALIDVTRGRAA